MLQWTGIVIAVVIVLLSSRVSATEEKYPVLKVAAMQVPVGDDLDANLTRVLQGVSRAASAGARIVVFPETVLSGFERATIEAIDWTQLAAAMDAIATAARGHNLYVIYGCATPSPFERPFNSAIVVGPDGEEVHRYHKSFPEPWFEPGDKLSLFRIDGVPCTVIVCHDNRFPELVRVPVLAGARICFYISYEINGRLGAEAKREGYRAQSIARAVENGIWWVQANGVGPVGASTLSLGNSVVVAPSGQVVARAPELEDAMLVVDVNPAAAGRGNPREGLGGKVLGGWWRAAVEDLKAQTGSHGGVGAAPAAQDGLQ
jgi:predicted amidohydrolase